MEVLGCTWTELLYNIVICQSSIIYERSLCGTQSPGSCRKELLIFTATAKKGKKSFEESEAKLQSVKQHIIHLLKLLFRKTKLDQIDELQGHSVVSNLKPQLAHYHNLFLTMKENCQDLHRNVFYFGHLLFFAKTTLVGNDSCL